MIMAVASMLAWTARHPNYQQLSTLSSPRTSNQTKNLNIRVPTLRISFPLLDNVSNVERRGPF